MLRPSGSRASNAGYAYLMKQQSDILQMKNWFFPFSVLMSVYRGEKAPHFDRAMKSLDNQTIPPTEIVIVQDGPLTESLLAIIKKWKKNLPLRTTELSVNRGLGYALRAGLAECSHSLVARMDSDDICHPERFQKQLTFLYDHPKIDVAGSWISEFENDETNIYGSRKLPVNPHELSRYARKRNPLNHMTVMFRLQPVLNAGSYQSFPGFEDYHLWARMLLNDSRFANIPEYLVNVRAGSEMLKRRGGKTYARNELKLQKEFLRMGFINYAEFLRNVLIRYSVRLMPQKTRRHVYKLLHS
jgi:glycosyltransferase involved in cell wall biosynthesis